MVEILVVKTGDAAAEVRRAFGDYDRWFLRALANRCGPEIDSDRGLLATTHAGWGKAPGSGTDAAANDSGSGGAGGARAGFRLRVIEVHRGARLPAGVAGIDRVIVTGSPRSVRERAPWMATTAAWLRWAAERVPVLGVCFGHQLLGTAFGARVERRAAGRELGTVSCALTGAGRSDPLFAGVADTFAVQATHEDELVDAPAHLEVLASNDACRIQAFRVGDRVRAVQFHPELDAATMRALVVARAGALEAEARSRGEGPRERVEALLAGVREAPAGPRILGAFVAGLRREAPRSTAGRAHPPGA